MKHIKKLEQAKRGGHRKRCLQKYPMTPCFLFLLLTFRLLNLWWWSSSKRVLFPFLIFPFKTFLFSAETRPMVTADKDAWYILLFIKKNICELYIKIKIKMELCTLSNIESFIVINRFRQSYLQLELQRVSNA